MQITIQEAALKRGKTLYRLSTDLGIPPQTVYDWQKWNRMPGPDYLDAICSYLTCSINELLKPETIPVQPYYF
jgi:DNA-binding Xre family transcriptional regulator